MKKCIICVLTAFVLCISSVALSLAENIIQPRDAVFTSASIQLDSNKQATYRCVTKSSCNSLYVVSCYLEHYISGEWVTIRTLTPPSLVLSGIAYSYTLNHSDAIGTGRYRIWATFSADGYTITRCSNERTY